MNKYTVEVVMAIVTEWDSEREDWGNNEFVKGGFTLGDSKSNKLDDILEMINTLFDVSKDDIYIETEFTEGGHLIKFTVFENGYGEQSLEGNFMVDYTVEVIESRQAEIVQ